MVVKINDPKYFALNCKKIFSSVKYEMYLLEVLNNSNYFLEQSNYEKYKFPISESKSECDAISEMYQLDFKLLIDQELMHQKAVGKPNVDISNIKKGYIFVNTKDNVKKYSEQNILFYLKDFDLSNLNSKLEKIVDNMKINKNLFWFFPYHIMNISKCNLQKIFNINLKRILNYRHSLYPDRDVYVCANINNSFIIFKWDIDKLVFVDEIPELLCPIYRDIQLYSVY